MPRINLREWLIALIAMVSVLVSSLALGATPAAAATKSTVADQVERYLATHPGGRQISATDVAYGDGALIVSVVRTNALSGPDCPSGWFCFYDGINYTYPRGKLSDCGFQALSTWYWQNRTESVHYNLSTGSVTFLDETGSLDTILFSVSTSRRTMADVGSARNRADYVFRYC